MQRKISRMPKVISILALTLLILLTLGTAGTFLPSPLVNTVQASGSGANNFGTWSWRDGTICVTDMYVNLNGLPYNHGHAGIVAAAPYYNATMEANPYIGVREVYGRWDERFSGRVYQVNVRETTDAQDHAAAVWTHGQIGKPYWFPITLSERRGYYCSQLVHAAFMDTAGVNLDTFAYPGFIHPFELLDPKNVEITFRRLP